MSLLKIRIPWTVDASGALRGVVVHDGSLLEFHTGTDRQSYLIQSMSSGIIEVELRGVFDFNIVKLWPGAIVAEIFVRKLADVPAQIWSLEDGAWNTLFDGKTSSEQARCTAARWTEAVPEAYLFQMLCSYGGTFAAVCNEITVHEHPASG